MATFSAPVRKKDTYVSTIRAEGRRERGGCAAPLVKIAECQILSVRSLAAVGETGSSAGYLAKLLFPADTEAAAKLAAFDDAAAVAMRENNEKWFRNNLSADAMAALFRPAMSTPPGSAEARVATVLISEVKEPEPLMLDGAAMESLSALAAMETRTLRTMRATCILEAQGLYFYPRRCGIRWRLRSLALTSETSAAEEVAALAGITFSERRSIEDHWSEEVAAFASRMDAAIAHCEAQKRAAAELLAEAKDFPAKDEKRWNDVLEALRLKIYRTTRILSGQ